MQCFRGGGNMFSEFTHEFSDIKAINIGMFSCWVDLLCCAQFKYMGMQLRNTCYFRLYINLNNFMGLVTQLFWLLFGQMDLLFCMNELLIEAWTLNERDFRVFGGSTRGNHHSPENANKKMVVVEEKVGVDDETNLCIMHTFRRKSHKFRVCFFLHLHNTGKKCVL